jgi:hypothetical protein
MTIYLYKKTHLTTGMNYLGITCKNPYKYLGSGSLWKKHLEEYGNHIRTEILKECRTQEEVKEWGSYYSNLWNVVDCQDWANLQPESGQGSVFTRSVNKLIWVNPPYAPENPKNTFLGHHTDPFLLKVLEQGKEKIKQREEKIKAATRPRNLKKMKGRELARQRVNKKTS